MEYYRRQPFMTTPETGADVAATVVENVGRTLRQLLPFPSSAGPSLPAAAALPVGKDLVSQLPKLVPSLEPQSAAAIVSEAAAILDEEMARGVLAARGARQPSDSSGVDPASAVWRQLHDLIDNVSRLWPTHGIPTSASQGLIREDYARHEGIPQLKPPSPLRRGQRGTVSMSLCNKEDRPVLLTPVATDLISSTGGRLSSSVFEFVPKAVRLEPAAQMDVVGQVVIPSDCTPGCFAGLLVVTGVDYLRAVITIEVE